MIRFHSTANPLSFDDVKPIQYFFGVGCTFYKSVYDLYDLFELLKSFQFSIHGFLPNIIRVINSRRVWKVACVEGMTNTFKILVKKPERKRPLGRPMHRWEDIKMDLRETGWEGVDWMHLDQDRDQWQTVVNTVKNLQVP
jgi:hypothetical protein